MAAEGIQSGFHGVKVSWTQLCLDQRHKALFQIFVFCGIVSCEQTPNDSLRRKR